MPHFHFGPLTPDLGEVLNILEVDLSSLLEHFAGTSQIRFRLTCSPTFFVELGKVNIQAVEVRCSPARSDSRECACVRLRDLQDVPDQFWWRNKRPCAQTFSSS